MTSGPHVLLLGGSGEGRRLAAAFVDAGLDVTSSLAGRVADPLLPVGRVRTGGFGGPPGLRDWLRAHRVRAVVDATHPFAVRISASTRAACAQAGVPLVVVLRPPWTAGPGNSNSPSSPTSTRTSSCHAADAASPGTSSTGSRRTWTPTCTLSRCSPALTNERPGRWWPAMVMRMARIVAPPVSPGHDGTPRPAEPRNPRSRRDTSS